MWQDWNITTLGGVLLVYNFTAVVIFDMTREDNILSGFYLISSSEGPILPVEFRGEVVRFNRLG